MTPVFGSFVRQRREQLQVRDPRYSLRQVARRIGVQPAYLSQVERNNQAPPSEATIRALAAELDEDPDVLLALAGKVSAELQAIIRRHPREFAELLRSLRKAPEQRIQTIVREVRDGNW